MIIFVFIATLKSFRGSRWTYRKYNRYYLCMNAVSINLSYRANTVLYQ